MTIDLTRGFLFAMGLALSTDPAAAELNPLIERASSPLLPALCQGDLATFGAAPLVATAYAVKLAEPYEDPSVWFRIGPELQSELDPFLLPALNARLMLDAEAMNQMMGMGLESMLGAFTGLAEARERNVEENTFDVGSEVTEFLGGGLTDDMMALAVQMRAGQRDALLLLRLASEDIEAWWACYDNLRAFAGTGSAF